jgi:tripartite ATP-independent transporter DctM subunit
MSQPIIGVIGIVILILVMLTRMPIAFVFALVGLGGFAYSVKASAALNLLAVDFFEVFSSYHLTVIPLFVLMGQIAFHAGISEKLYMTGYKLFGRVRGGLAMGTIAACAAFAACCGSSPASAATMGAVALPEMRKYDYSNELATGSIAAGGSLGILIPPSVILIIYGIMAEQSIAKLFIAGIIPGIILSCLFIFTIYMLTLMRPRIGPAGPASSFEEKIKAVLGGIGEPLAIFILIIGGLFLGFFTPSEAGAVGASGMLVIALTRRKLSWRGLLAAFGEALQTSAMILLIIAGATVFGHFLASTRLPFSAASWVTGLDLPGSVIMLLIIFVYLIGGCVMDAMALLLLTIPIFFPVSQALGYDPIWFGVIIVLVIEMATISPPVGINVYVLKGIAKDIPLETIFKGIVPFLIAEIVMVILLLFFPVLAIFLPGLMG